MKYDIDLPKKLLVDIKDQESDEFIDDMHDDLDKTLKEFTKKWENKAKETE